MAIHTGYKKLTLNDKINIKEDKIISSSIKKNFLLLQIWKKINDKTNDGNKKIFCEKIMGRNIGEETIHSSMKFFSLADLNLSKKYKLMKIRVTKFKYEPKFSLYKTNPIKLKISVYPDTKKSG